VPLYHKLPISADSPQLCLLYFSRRQRVNEVPHPKSAILIFILESSTCAPRGIIATGHCEYITAPPLDSGSSRTSLDRSCFPLLDSSSANSALTVSGLSSNVIRRFFPRKSMSARQVLWYTIVNNAIIGKCLKNHEPLMNCFF
jgi:hypothetical protein